MTEQRIITQADPRTAPPDGQYVGRVEPERPKAQTWKGPHPESVITQMNSDLPPIPADDYQIIEGGWREEASAC